MMALEKPFKVDPISNLAELLRYWSERAPDSEAIAAPGCPGLTYGELARQIADCAAVLRKLGFQRSDRVALALPQGPECLTACLGAAAACIAAPLNPELKAGEFERIFRETDPKALVLVAGSESPAHAVAKTRGMLVMEVYPDPKAAGTFKLGDETAPQPVVSMSGNDDDIALLLSTSGTTSRPKFVPLLHRHICAAAANTCAAFGIQPGDRCLDLAPLYHAHGLVAGALASLIGGATVICPRKFEVERFFSWLIEMRPTWMTAVPTIHQAILQEASHHLDVVARQQLRCIRSASAYLPDSTRAELERVFRTIVVEGYGLTEAMQLTNTPLDPAKRKVGSLGLPGTSEIGIADENGLLLGPGQAGEIVARGPVVIGGYWNRPEPDRESFRNGWFRTGDLGYLDQDGHLFMTGRLKDQINQGGEKIAPQEVDEILQAHPAVAQAMAFGLPHPTLGEEVAAAVVLRQGASASADEIRKYLAERLEEVKVPRRIFMTSKIPVNSMGKFLRREVAAHFDSATISSAYVGPRNALEQHLAEVWQRLLGKTLVGIDDDFFDLGGNSLLATRLFSLLAGESNVVRPAYRQAMVHGQGSLLPNMLWGASTIRQLAERLSVELPEDLSRKPIMVVQKGSERSPFIMLSGDWGGHGFYVRNLAKFLDPGQPVWSLAPHDPLAHDGPRSIEAMAESYLATIRSIQSTGPYMIGGFSHSGLIAFEIARRLEAQGADLNCIFIIDSFMPHPRLSHVKRTVHLGGRLFGRTHEQREELFELWRDRLTRGRNLVADKGLAHTVDHYLRSAMRRPRPFTAAAVAGQLAERGAPVTAAAEIDPMSQAYLRVIGRYVPRGVLSSEVTLVSSVEGPAAWYGNKTLGWERVTRRLQLHKVPGSHLNCIIDHVEQIAGYLQDAITRGSDRKAQ